MSNIAIIFYELCLSVSYTFIYIFRIFCSLFPRPLNEFCFREHKHSCMRSYHARLVSRKTMLQEHISSQHRARMIFNSIKRLMKTRRWLDLASL